MSNPDDSLTRRGLLGRALSAAALVSAIEGGGQLTAQAPGAPPHIRDTFDFGWKFFKGDAPGAEEPGLCRRGLEKLRYTTRLERGRSVCGERAQRRAGGNAPTGIGWYRKHFRVPASYQGRNP